MSTDVTNPSAPSEPEPTPAALKIPWWTPGDTNAFFGLGFNTLVNAAGATITGGDGAAGLAVQGNDATVTNAGIITLRDSAPGILVQGDRAVVTNTGSIVARDDSVGWARCRRQGERRVDGQDTPRWSDSAR